MEQQFQHTVNGQAVEQDDLNVLGETSGLADDRVFAELFRIQPYDGSAVHKGVLPAAHRGAGESALVGPNGASGSVLVNPFRALVGSRTAVATDAKKNWRNIRSAIAVGSTTLGQSVALSANASGNPRWDLVYAAVAVDANSASVTRKVKDPTTKVIAGQSVVTTLQTTVTLGVVTGTPAASPAWPSLPSDSGGTYYIPLAFVRVPDGFSAASTVDYEDIGIVAPCLSPSNATGGTGIEVADCHYVENGGALTTAKIGTWGSSGAKPGIFVPSVAVGGTTLLIALDLATGSQSHDLDGVVDSRDWRGRLARWTAVVSTATDTFAWTAGVTPFPHYSNRIDIDNTANKIQVGVGNSLASVATQADSRNQDRVVDLDAADLVSMAAGSSIYLYVDWSDGGKLKLYDSRAGTAPNCKVFLWLEFSGVFENFNR